MTRADGDVTTVATGRDKLFAVAQPPADLTDRVRALLTDPAWSGQAGGWAPGPA